MENPGDSHNGTHRRMSMSARTCCAVSDNCAPMETVGVYLLNALEPAEHDAFTRHLTCCPACQAEVEELAPVTRLLGLVPRDRVPPFPSSGGRRLSDSGYGYGLWGMALINTLGLVVFVASFVRPKTSRDWRTLGTFSGFAVALFTHAQRTYASSRTAWRPLTRGDHAALRRTIP